MSLILIGLPPDPVKIQEFVDDPSDENYVRLVDHDRHEGWSFAGCAADQGFAKAGDFSVLYQGDMVLDKLWPAGFYSHTVSQKLNATVRSPLLPQDKKYVSYHVTGYNKSACRTIIDNCHLPYFHTQWFEKPEFS